MSANLLDMEEQVLPDRQRLILKEIVDRYIRLREPVSSRMILEAVSYTHLTLPTICSV